MQNLILINYCVNIAICFRQEIRKDTRHKGKTAHFITLDKMYTQYSWLDKYKLCALI